MAKHLLSLVALFAVLPLAGCISVPPAYGPVASACTAQATEATAATNPIYFVTTGLPDCAAGKPLSLTVGRGTFHPYGEAAPDPVRYGVATPGTPEQPTLALEPAAAWHQQLARDLHKAQPERILLYVHGYNNSTAYALSSTDQIAMAGHFDGPVVAFLWPSQHSLTKYTWDEANVRWTQIYFDAVLADLAAQTPDLVLVAHSMGNRLAIDGLRHLQARDPALAAHIRLVVLAAPDVDREMFDRDIAPDIVRPGRRVALFASGLDLALRSSWAVHGNPRVGDLGCIFRLRRTRRPVTEAPRCYPDARGTAGALTVIDSTDLPRTSAGHSNHIETPEGRATLRALLAPDAPPLPADKGVLQLHPAAQPECTGDGASRLKMDFTMQGCPPPAKKKRKA